MATLSELPIEVLLDNLFPFLSARDLLRLTCTSKFLAVLCCDDAVWKRKLLVDFNFTGEGTARTSGWKTIYRGLSRPKVYAWGEKANGRLGVVNFPKSSVHGVPFPFPVKIPGVRIVSLVAGGMSFHALDSEGGIHVWGTLDGSTYALNNEGFSDPGKRTDTPLKLDLPTPIRSISCGRLHSSALDHLNRVWTFPSWGRPFCFTSPILNNPLSIAIQIECGWMFSSLLTVSGEVYVWWPFSGPLREAISQNNERLDAEGNKKAVASPNGTIPCVTWSVGLEPSRLPVLPHLPELTKTGKEKSNPMPQLIQIAGFDNHIIGLTNHGHVLKFGGLDNETTVSQGRWEYLPKFSDLNHIKEHKVFSEESENRPKAPETLQVTHISANFKHFVAYSTGASSIVLIGNVETTADTDPEIKPALQNRSVISVVIGDYHNAALTSDGKLYTWGSFSAGALGLGDPANLEPGTPGGYASSSVGGRRRREPPEVDTPTEVSFNHGSKSPKDRFCFAVTAAGWHTGALVIDLEPDGDEEEEFEMESKRDTDPNHVPDLDRHGQYETPPILPPFRIGHAGRGNFGRGRDGLNPNPSLHHAQEPPRE